jgi:cobalamin biosynthetic protein CobC
MKHGGDLSEAIAEGGGSPADWIDLSTGINPYPWPIPPDLLADGLTRLPGRDALGTLLAAARNAYRVPDSFDIVAAPGTQALIQWLPRLAPAGPVAILGPTYSEHGLCWRGAGLQTTEITDLGTMSDARHLVVVNPNNPDGRVTRPAELLRAARGIAERGGWCVIDESFADVSPGASVLPHLRDEPAIVLRSFGKFYGLPGLRLGFAMAPTPIAELIERALGPWAVSGPALAIGRAALADAGWADVTRERLLAEARSLDGVLSGAGLEMVGGTSLFRLARARDAVALHARLAEARIWVRRFPDRPDLLRFGLPADEAARHRLALALG